MNEGEYRKRFQTLYSNLLGVAATYYSWKGLQDEKYRDVYERAKYFWGAVLIALQNEWLSGLARCFEESSYSDSNKVISVKALLLHYSSPEKAIEVEALLNKHQSVISSIARLRDHQLAHLNAQHLSDPSKLLKRFPVKYDDIEALLKDLPELLSQLNPESGIGYVLHNYTEEPLWEAAWTIKQMQYFNKKEREYLDKFISGESDSFKFPPDDTNAVSATL